ncbi:MAG: hypothetical protein GY715_18570 [Planctomycetes bacterium]|nr:hypothetical protein [Planctomycetota bacterium]
MTTTRVRTTDAAATFERELIDADDVARVQTWRDQGADEATVAWCWAERRLDEIIATQRDRWPHVVIAGAPGEAATRLGREIAERDGLARRPLAHGALGRERNIDRDLVPSYLAEPSLAVLHAKATTANVEILERMAIAPIVVVEPLTTLLVRARDALGRGGPFDAFVHVPPGFGERREAARLRFAAHACTPWLVSFLFSWQEAADRLHVRWRHVVDDAAVELPADIMEIARAVAAPYRDDFDLAPLGIGGP